MAGAEPPLSKALFYQPSYTTASSMIRRPSSTFAAEASWRRTGPSLDMRITAFAVAVFDGLETRRYYDDLAALFCDMSVAGIGRLCLGIEAAAEMRLSYRWSLALAASAAATAISAIRSSRSSPTWTTRRF